MGVLYDSAGRLLRAAYDFRLQAPAVLDETAFFPDGARFRAAWAGLREEALAVGRDLGRVPRFHELMSQQADISAADGRDWRMLVVKAYGVRVDVNAARCPRLAGLVEQCPEVLTASLSFLAPGKLVPAHRGPFRGVLRYHLGLVVPRDEAGRPAAVLTVDGVEHRIGEGESLLWDDTYRHEVRNPSEQLRVALLLDVRRRDLPPDLRLLSRVLIAGAGAVVRLRAPG